MLENKASKPRFNERAIVYAKLLVAGYSSAKAKRILALYIKAPGAH